MFFFRTVFWLSLVVLVLPTDQQQQAKLYATVSSAAHQAATFCDRNKNLCAKGAEHWATFRSKLEFGARMAIDVATERMQGPAAGPERPAGASLKPAVGTLTPDDLGPGWRGRTTRSGA
ncbi:MAG: hypothetical protein ACKVP7_00920 [Hyphomicrobiaceae bacterium]